MSAERLLPVTSMAPIAPRIASVRGQRVIIDADLAALYGVQTKRFNEAVKRNLGKFPADFMFVLTAEETAALRSQFATSSCAPDLEITDCDLKFWIENGSAVGTAPQPGRPSDFRAP